MTRVRNGLNEQARETIKWWWWGDSPKDRVTIAGYIRFHFGPDAKVWLGDECGCMDDRCIDHHHWAGMECGCLPVWLEEYVDVLTGRKPDPYGR